MMNPAQQQQAPPPPQQAPPQQHKRERKPVSVKAETCSYRNVFTERITKNSADLKSNVNAGVSSRERSTTLNCNIRVFCAVVCVGSESVMLLGFLG